MSMFLALVCEYTYIAVCLMAMKYLWKQEVERKFCKYFVVIITIAVVSIFERTLNIEEVLIYPVEVCCIMFLIKERKIRSFMQFFMTDILLGILQKMVVYLVIMAGLATYEYTQTRGIEKLILRVCTLIIIVLLGRWFKQYSSYLQRLTWYHMGICIIIEVCLGIIITQAELGMFFNGKKIANTLTMGLVLLACMVLLAVIVIFIVVDINRKHYQEQNRLKDDYLAIQEKYYKTIAHKDEEVRKVRHDLKAHLGCIEILLEEKKYQEAEKYVRELKNDTMKRIDTSYKSGNDVINAVLDEIADAAIKHDTKIVLLGILPQNIKIESPELCSLFYNLLSNSEEAMKEYRGELPREIYLEISNYKRSVKIIVKNPVEMPIEISMLGKYTSKGDKKLHGYGIENIRTIVEKYNGFLEYENKKGYLICNITFLNIINC